MGLIFLFNFASVLHKKHTILCNTKHELHKMECFFTALTPFVLLNFRALKGQKLIAQGSALGIKADRINALKGQQKRQP